MFQVNLNDYAEGARLAEWVPYVQAAREEREQNIEAFVKEGQLYYRTLRNLQPNSELCVWYSDDFAQILGVPELQSIHFTGKWGSFSKETISFLLNTYWAGYQPFAIF